MKLYGYFRSSATIRVKLALYFKNIKFEETHIHLIKEGGEHLSTAYKEINPQGLVPALIDEESTITQSLAIIEYLEEKYPTPSLFPKDPILKAKARAMSQTIACDIHPLNNLRVLNYLKNDLHVSDAEKNKWYKHWISEGLMSLELMLKNEEISGKYCIGDSLSIADICLVPQIYNAIRYECDLQAYPIIMKIFNNCETLEIFKQAKPKEDPGPSFIASQPKIASSFMNNKM